MAIIDVLERIGSLEEDSIWNIEEVLKTLGVDQITEARTFPGRIGQTVQIWTEDQRELYFGLSEFGYVEIVREGSPDGEIVYMPID